MKENKDFIFCPTTNKEQCILDMKYGYIDDAGLSSQDGERVY